MANQINTKSTFKIIFDRYRRVILIAVFFIVLFAGFFGILRQPLQGYQANIALKNKLDADIISAKSELASAQNYSSKIYSLTPAETKLLNMALPTKPDFSALIEQLTTLSQKAGFTVNNVDIEETSSRSAANAASDNVGKISVRLKISGGGYEEFKQLIGLLESSVMLVDVYSINFTSKSPIYDLNLVVYYYRKI